MSLNLRLYGLAARNDSQAPGHAGRCRRVVRMAAAGMLALVAGVSGVLVEPVQALAQADAKKIPDPEDIDLTTTDGVQLKATYFKSIKGKEAVPVMMVHGFKGNRHDFDALAKKLQALGHAVIVPDLRGHGDSTTVQNFSKKLAADKLLPPHFALMASKDLEAVKAFLVKRNNDGELNIDKLCVVGAEMGASVGLLWSALDWSWPMLTIGKQGQDVKAIVMISPKWSDHRIQVPEALSNDGIKRMVSIYIVMGADDPDAVKEAKRIFKTFEVTHPEPDAASPEKKDLFYDETKKTRLQGTKLLNEPSMQLDQYIISFIDLRAVQAPFPWKERKQGN
jgi:pimeloyl-ACP methyl ester carboxylesterase